MAQATTKPPADTGDPVSNAVVSPEASLLVRQMVESALNSQGGTTASWTPEAQALLANVLMNDYLNWWNPQFPVDLNAAQNYVNLTLSSNPSDLTQAHAFHAQGLIYRTQRTPQSQQAAFDAFTQALNKDGGFARAHAQLGNQKVLLGEAPSSHGHFQAARNLNPHHPACGYFDWGEGRAYFEETISLVPTGRDWSKTIDLLTKSVHALPTVWYNRCYLAAAQDAAGKPTDATKSITDFINLFGMDILKQAVASLQDNSSDPRPVRDMRAAVLAYIKKFIK